MRSRYTFSIDYFIAILPIALSHLIHPPLSYVQGREDIPDVLREFFTKIYVNIPYRWLSYEYLLSLALVYDNKLWKKPFVEAGWLSYMTVHVNYKHLLYNLIGAIQLGHTVWSDYGAVGLYTLYIAGGIASAIPSFITDGEKAPELFNLISSGQTSTQESSLYQKMYRSVDGYRKSILNTLIPKMAVGSSGAVCSLIGYQLTNSIKLLAGFAKNVYILNYGSQSAKFLLRSRYRAGELDPTDISVVSSLVWDIGTIGMYLAGEYNNIKSPIIMDGSQVGHGNHIQGALFGIVFGVVVDWIVAPVFFKKSQ